jgi:hypothetical protein
MKSEEQIAARIKELNEDLKENDRERTRACRANKPH